MVIDTDRASLEDTLYLLQHTVATMLAELAGQQREIANEEMHISTLQSELDQADSRCQSYDVSTYLLGSKKLFDFFTRRE